MLAILAVYLVMRLGMLHDLIQYRFGMNVRYHYVCMPILLLAGIVGGRLLSVLGGSLGIWMTAFTVWMGACIPTSAWRGGSFVTFKNYVLNDFTVFFVLGCLTCALSAQKRAVYAMGLVLPVFILTLAGTFSTSAYGERAMMEYGTYGNPNSIASHLLFLCPFLICAMRLSKASWFFKSAGVAALFGGFFFFVRTGSRAGLLALLVMLAAVFISLPISKKAVALLLFVLTVPVFLALLPDQTLLRYRTTFSRTSGLELSEDEAQMLDAAAGSSFLRKQLLKESVAISFRKPLFGVGPGQFNVYSANQAKAAGKRANWMFTHNTYTQVSSEMGLVGFVFYMGVLLTTGFNLWRMRNRLREIPYMQPASLIASCLLLAWLGYCVFSAFDHLAYQQYLPVLAGFTVGLKAVIESEMGNGAAPAALTPLTGTS